MDTMYYILLVSGIYNIIVYGIIATVRGFKSKIFFKVMPVLFGVFQIIISVSYFGWIALNL